MSYVFLNGQITPSHKAQISIFDHGLLYGDGIYDSLRGYKNQVWNFEAHIDRFFHGAKTLKIDIPYSKTEILQATQKLLILNKHEESRIRIYASRGANNYNFSDSKNPTLIITVVPIPVFPKESGKLITTNLERPVPEIKSSSLIVANLCRQKCEEQQAVDALLIDQNGYIPEGSICNYFIVKNNTLITPTEKNLPGTTQNLILNLAKKNKIPVQTKKLTLKDLHSAHEIFITSVYKHVLPITTLNDLAISNNKPGPISLQLQKLLHQEYQNFKDKTDQNYTQTNFLNKIFSLLKKSNAKN
jgi:branched-chain amino acid aminotransferase